MRGRAPALLLSLLLLTAFPLPAADAMPFESPASHQAGWWNATFTDSASTDLNVTVFYPALTAAEDATPDQGAAPYPALVLLSHVRVRPPFAHYRSYGEHLAQRGFVVAMPNMHPYDGSITPLYEEMVNASLDTVGFLAAESDRSGSPLEDMVDPTSVAMAGHGMGGHLALKAARKDGGSSVHAIATLDLLEISTMPGQGAWRTGEWDMPLHFQVGAAEDVVSNSVGAFREKARGYVSVMEIDGANFTQFTDLPNETLYPGWHVSADLNHSDQQNLSRRYLLAFLDRHLKDDTMAGDRLYGAQARADLEDRTLTLWLYGVLDLSVELTRPQRDAQLPTGPVTVNATVTNVGPFPMPSRNVTLEVVRMVQPGGAFQRVYGPVNASTDALAAGANGTLGWRTLPLDQYGDYIAFVRMGDPDHNTSNDRHQVPFELTPLAKPRIEHQPPEALELAEVTNVTCRLRAPAGIDRAVLNLTDVDGLPRRLTMAHDAATDLWWAVMPAQLTIGEVYYRIEVLALNGASNMTDLFIVPVVDSLPPVIVHEPVEGPLPVAQELRMEATVTDRGAVAYVRLAYRDPETGSHNVTCGREGDVWFHPLDPGALEGTLEYTWYAEDSWGNLGSHGPHRVPLVDSGPPAIVPQGPSEVELGQEVSLLASVDDDARVVQVWLVYRLPGTGKDVNGTPGLSAGLWRIILPSSGTPGTLTYSWWARDVNGRTATTGELELEVVDTESPLLSDIRATNVTVGAAPTVMATVEDAGELAWVTVEYTDVHGEAGAVDMTMVAAGRWEAELPVQDMGGALRFQVLAQDATGNLARSSNRTVVVQDVEPPELAHDPPGEVVEGQRLTLTLTVTDNVGVSSVLLYLRLSPQGSFRKIEMAGAGGDSYEHVIEASLVEPPELRYYFEVEDMPPSSNVARLPEAAPLTAYRVNVTHAVLSIFGTVRTGDGKALPANTQVGLVGEDNFRRVGSDGGYRIENVTSGVRYTLRVTSPGYQPFEFDFSLTPATGDRELDVVLSPRPGSQEVDGLDMAVYIGILLLIAAVGIVVVVMSRRARDRRG